MLIVVLWVVLSFIVASMGAERECGFWATLLLSFIFSPIVGLIVVALSKSKADIKHQKIMQQAALAQKKEATVSMADEVEKLKKLFDSGAITEPEYNQMKSKILS